jgi:polyhydroxybutyrate depolymerase
LVLHGGGGNAAITETTTGFTQKGKKEGFIVVYPEGTSQKKDKLLTWNARHCCGYAMYKRVNDVAFINALLDKLIKDYPIDPKRIYVTGISNGGMMTHRLGIELPNRIAAIAPVVAAVFGDEPMAAQPVSALMLNGMRDKSVPYLGGPPGGPFVESWDGTPVKPTLDQATHWARTNGCQQHPDKQESASSTRWQYRCPAGIDVDLHLLKDQTHGWPGGQYGKRQHDKAGAGLNATDTIWEFFKAHAK